MKHETDSSFYTQVKLFDSSFGISPIALSIANLLPEKELSGFVNQKDAKMFSWHTLVKSYPFHNGREHGICLIIDENGNDKSLFVVFGENRNSDQIFIDSWIGNKPFNAPSLNDFSEEAYGKRKYMDYNQIYEASQFIRELIHSHLTTIVMRLNKKEVKNSKSLSKV